MGNPLPVENLITGWYLKLEYTEYTNLRNMIFCSQWILHTHQYFYYYLISLIQNTRLTGWSISMVEVLEVGKGVLLFPMPGIFNAIHSIPIGDLRMNRSNI